MNLKSRTDKIHKYGIAGTIDENDMKDINKIKAYYNTKDYIIVRQALKLIIKIEKEKGHIK